MNEDEKAESSSNQPASPTAQETTSPAVEITDQEVTTTEASQSNAAPVTKNPVADMAKPQPSIADLAKKTAPLTGSPKILHRNKLKIVGLVLAILLVFGAGVFAYAKFTVASPQDRVNDAIENLLSAEGFSYKQSIDADGIDASIEGVFNQTQPAISGKATYGVPPVFGGGEIVLDVRAIKDRWYIKIDGLKQAFKNFMNTSSATLGDYGFLSEDVLQLVEDSISQFDGKWVYINDDILASIVNSLSFFVGESLDLPKIGINTYITDELMSAIRNSYASAPFVVVVEEKGSEGYEGVSVDVFEVTTDNALVKEFIAALDKAETSLETEFNIDFGDLDVEPIETDEESNLLIYLDGDKIVKVADPSDTARNYLGISHEVTMVEEPDDAEAFSTSFLGGLFAGIVGASFEGVQQRAQDTERKTDINATHTHLEVFYNDWGFYPSQSDMTSSDWRASNMPGLDQEATIDPNGLSLGAAGSDYTYSPSDCEVGECRGYSLSSTLVDDPGPYLKKSLN